LSDYIYAVTRVHNQEPSMLTRADLERLIAANTAGEALRLLREKGWGTADLPEGDADAVLAFEQSRAWALVAELVKDLSPFDILRVGADYHNLKAAMKLRYADHPAEDAPRYLMENGTMPAEQILRAVEARDEAAVLPPDMAEAARRAAEALLHTGSGQIADFILDAARLAAVDRFGGCSPSPMMRLYARVSVDAAVARIAARAARMGIGRDALLIAIPEAGSLGREAMVAAALKGPEAVPAALEQAGYAGAAEALRRGVAAMERWFDDHLMEALRPMRFVYDGVEPIFAYLIGREREIGAARLILAAKLNGMKNELVQERLRVLYV
jgi:V/A-type H+-transporting ATPase subunit C